MPFKNSIICNSIKKYELHVDEFNRTGAEPIHLKLIIERNFKGLKWRDAMFMNWNSTVGMSVLLKCIFKFKEIPIKMPFCIN